MFKHYIETTHKAERIVDGIYVVIGIILSAVMLYATYVAPIQ
jgi:hypothetical protein